MAKIIQLSEQLSNMIAAGEVVEGPLSVVKELVENSIDANSSNIEIYLQESGINLIEIIDNGFGMDKEDAKLSFSRHATSKISTEGDLFRISSLGFRGEAIPSIASVSHMTMITRSDNHNGYYIKYEAGKLVDCIDYACNKGTKISIEKLFYNTPARLKYLKSPNSILSSIVDVITRLSIAYPNISFKLVNNNNTVFQTHGKGDMINLLANIYEVNIGRSIKEVVKEVNGFKLKAYVAKPEFTRSRKSEITIIVNNRYVKSNLIVDAVIESYRNYLPQGRYPICVINVTVDPLLIDVNVHPSKMEIKFSLEDTIHNLVKTAIDSVLTTTNLISEHRTTQEKVGTYTETLIDLVVDNKDTLNLEEPLNLVSNISNKTLPHTVIKEEVYNYNNVEINNQNMVKPVVQETIIKESTDKLPYMEYVGIMFGTYLVFQNNDGMYLIDQHAAQERIKYEYYFNEFSNPKKESIDLLIPHPIDLTLSESLLLSDNLSKLEEIGLILEQSGPQNFIIRSIPIWVKDADAESIIEKIVTFLISKKDFNIGIYRDNLAKMVSCKESIKGNNHTTKEEIDYLIGELRKCKNPFNCPHGRPSIVKMSVYEIEKMFKRVV